MDNNINKKTGLPWREPVTKSEIFGTKVYDFFANVKRVLTNILNSVFGPFTPFIAKVFERAVVVRGIENENAQINTFRNNQGLDDESYWVTYVRYTMREGDRILAEEALEDQRLTELVYEDENFKDELDELTKKYMRFNLD